MSHETQVLWPEAVISSQSGDEEQHRVGVLWTEAVLAQLANADPQHRIGAMWPEAVITDFSTDERLVEIEADANSSEVNYPWLVDQANTDLEIVVSTGEIFYPWVVDPSHAVVEIGAWVDETQGGIVTLPLFAETEITVGPTGSLSVMPALIDLSDKLDTITKRSYTINDPRGL